MLTNREVLQQYQHAARSVAEKYYAANVSIPRMNRLIQDSLLNKDG
jgi:hypothetical protein